MAKDYTALIAAIDAAEASSYGDDTVTQLAEDRQKAIEYYLGANVNPAPEGRSNVVDRTVFETVESVIPSLVRIFAGSDEVCKVLPVGPDDQEAAEQTTAVLNWTATQKNSWEQIVHDYAKDGLLLRNAYALAYWDDSQRVDREIYEGQSDDQLALLADDEGVTIVQHSQKPDDETNERNAQEYQQAVQMMQMQALQTGMPFQPPPPPQPAFLHDVVIDRSQEHGQVKICVLPPEHVKVAFNTPDHTLNSCDYFEYWEDKPISELRAMGLDVPDDIASDRSYDSVVDLARDSNTQAQYMYDMDGADPSMRRVKARMIWIRCDLEGNGTARLYYTIRVGNEILRDPEPCTRIPVASFCPLPMPHRHVGMSLADITTDLQDIKTAIKRGGLDNLYLANNGRHVISDQVSLEDMLTSRPGGVIRLQNGALPGQGHVMPLVHPFAFDSIIGSLNVFNQEQANRTGISPYFNGTDVSALNRTASGVNMLTQQSAQRVEQIARMMAPAIEYLFSCVLELIQKHQNKEMVFQLRGKWFNVDPLAWVTRRDIKIAVGVGAGNKDQMLAQLQQTFGMQAQIGLQTGIARPENLYQTAVETAKLQGFAQPEKFWNDPAKNPPPQGPNPEQVQQMMQQLQQLQQENQQLKVQCDQEKLSHAQTKLDNRAKDLQMDLADQHMGVRERALDLKELGMDVALQAKDAEGKTAERTMAEDEMDAQLMKALQGMADANKAQQDNMAAIADAFNRAAEAMIQAAQLMSAPKEVVRDQAGRVVGVKTSTLQ